MAYTSGTYTNAPSRTTDEINRAIRELNQKYGYTSGLTRQMNFGGGMNEREYNAGIGKFNQYQSAFDQLMNERKQAAQYYSPQGELMRGQQSAADSANQMNEKRYSELLGLADQQIAGAGQGQAVRDADIRSDYTKMQGDAHQRLVDLGMANTTIWPTLATGYKKKMQSALDASQASSQNEKNNALQTKMGVIERRNDAGPDMNSYLQLLNQYGRS